MKKILVIRFSSIGDIILTTPVLRCIKQQIADSEIHFVTKKAFGSLLENNPYLHKLHVFENDVDELYDTLKNENFHAVVDLHKNLRSLRLKQR